MDSSSSLNVSREDCLPVGFAAIVLFVWGLTATDLAFGGGLLDNACRRLAKSTREKDNKSGGKISSSFVKLTLIESAF